MRLALITAAAALMAATPSHSAPEGAPAEAWHTCLDSMASAYADLEDMRADPGFVGLVGEYKERVDAMGAEAGMSCVEVDAWASNSPPALPEGMAIPYVSHVQALARSEAISRETIPGMEADVLRFLRWAENF